MKSGNSNEVTSRLFVYGTLAPGCPNEHVLQPLNGHWQKAYVRGHLHRKGWGAALGYPALQLDPQAERVEGWLFSSTTLADFWPRLDAFEGDAYRRESVQVILASGERQVAWVYVVNE